MDNIALALSFIGQFSGPLFIITLAFIVIDIISGYLQAIANKCVDSSVMRTGFWHKLALILALILAAMIDSAISIEPLISQALGISAPIFEGACIFVIAMEATSTLENIKRIYPDLKSKTMFGMLGKSSETEDKEE